MSQHTIAFILKALGALLAVVFLSAASALPAPLYQADNPHPPDHVVKLIFIHHSTGENWLTDGYGNLGRALGANNYFVSDTNYGWGPNGIGDRTDIPNWTEWFASDSTPIYMEALFNESGQHSSYTRTLSDPGGENEIILFKSCFPNSNLDGNPTDPPGEYEDMTVSGAKYVYNTILQYFATRPDKLFIVITAPPVSEPTFAANARAFNNWLVNDWLRENNYTLNNVAVFDFYNVLTDPNAHHRFANGQVEHVLGSRNTLYYPSGDDHPSIEGSRKATKEFVPLLNVFYHRWQENAPLPPTTEPATVPEAGIQPEAQPGAPAAFGTIDDFDSVPLKWEAFSDGSPSTMMTCGAEAGSGRSGNSLRVNFNISANGWGTCARFFDSPQDWSASNGLVFYYLADQAGVLFNVDLYAGSANNRETYLYTIEAVPESAADWVRMELRWEDFHRAAWEENANAPFTKTNEVVGIAFGMNTLPDAPNVGSIRVDDIGYLGAVSAPVMEPAANPPAEPATIEPTEEPRRRGLSCGGAAILPLGLVALSLLQRKRQR